MVKLSNTKSGFTLVEVLVSVGIMLIFLPFAASMLTNSQLLASYSKHKIQAAYAAQQIIETQRQNAFFSFIGRTFSKHSALRQCDILDTKGNYANRPRCDQYQYFLRYRCYYRDPVGLYQLPPGSRPPARPVDHFVVSISWTEQILKLQVPMTETYAEDIANDTMLN